jgi:hypothetical protein
MKERQQYSTGYPIGFLLVLKSDHITGATGKAATIVLTISKNGSTFGSALGAVTETGNGWYNWAPNGGNSSTVGDRDTLGELKIHVTEPSCDPYDEKYDIVAYDPFAAVSLPAAERTAIADTILTRDWSQIVSWPARCMLQGLRLLRNKWSINPANSYLTVTTEDDSTTAWQMLTTSQAGADPIVGQAPTT